MRIWIDVEDLFHYAAYVSRPSGIQRLAFELQRALVALAPEEVRFVRHDRSGTGFVSVSFSMVLELFSGLTDQPSSEAQPETKAGNPHDLSGRPVRRFIRVRFRACRHTNQSSSASSGSISEKPFGHL